ncbi:MAG: hypothetical protein ACOCT0_00710 [Halobacteriota archaeon]
MERRHLMKLSAAAFVTTGCLDPGEDEAGEDREDDEPDERDGVYTDEGRTDEGEGEGFTYVFEVTSLETGEEVDEATAEHDVESSEVVVEGRTHGSDLCKTAQVESADMEGSALSLAVETRDVDEAGDVCAEGTREIGYEAVFRFDGELPTAVEVSHDGREIGVEGAGGGPSNLSDRRSSANAEHPDRA